MPTTHSGQDAVLASRARYRILACGRRWRKSTTAMIALVRAAESRPNGLYWWCWPTGPMGQIGWDMLRNAAAQVLPPEAISESRRRVILPNGAQIWIKSADHEDGLRGTGLDGLVMDECRDISARAWYEVLRPAIVDKRGWVMFLSTPRGYDWFYELYRRAEGAPDWERWSFTTLDNPTISPAEIESSRSDMPERLFRQEIMAEFLPDGAGVFRNVRALSTLPPTDPLPGHEYLIGVDWGRTRDDTVCSVWDIATRREVWLDRYTGIPYTLQYERVQALAQRYHDALVIVEANQAQDVHVEMLAQRGVRVMPYITTQAAKAAAIDRLAAALERAAVELQADDVGIRQMEALESSRTATGLIHYAAPSGMHDDIVIARMIAYAALDHGRLFPWEDDHVSIS